MTTPAHVAHWHPVDTAQAQQTRRLFLAKFRGTSVHAVGRMYQRSSGELAFFMGMMPAKGSPFVDELRDSRQTLVDYLGGAEVRHPRFVDAGPLGGQMACGEATLPGGVPDTVCAWADRGSLGAASFVGQSVRIVHARAITLELRDGATPDA